MQSGHQIYGAIHCAFFFLCTSVRNKKGRSTTPPPYPRKGYDPVALRPTLEHEFIFKRHWHLKPLSHPTATGRRSQCALYFGKAHYDLRKLSGKFQKHPNIGDFSTLPSRSLLFQCAPAATHHASISFSAEVDRAPTALPQRLTRPSTIPLRPFDARNAFSKRAMRPHGESCQLGRFSV